MTCLSRPNTASCTHPHKLAELRAALWRRSMILLDELEALNRRFLEQQRSQLVQGCPAALQEYRQLNVMMRDVLRVALNVLEHEEHDLE